MTRTMANGAASMRAMADAVPSAARLGLRTAAVAAAADLARAVRAGSGGDSRLTAGAVGVRLVRTDDDAWAVAATGPVRLMEDRVAPHEIRPRGGALAGNLDHPVAGAVRHPGHRARRVWTKGAAQAHVDAGQAFHPATIAAMRRAYTGG